MDASSATALAQARYGRFCRNEPRRDTIPFVISLRALRKEIDSNEDPSTLNSGLVATRPKTLIEDFLNTSQDGEIAAYKEAIARFCDDVSLDDFVNEIDAVTRASRVRLDDRSDRGEPRTNAAINLSALKLYSMLKQKRFDHPFLSDVPRRTITIWDPNKYHIFALAEAASDHERSRLIVTIYNYLRKRSEFKANITRRGRSSLWICFSLPVFLVRRHKEMPSPGWDPLPFLGLCEDSGSYMLYRTMLVVTLCAENETTWLAYVLRENIPRGELYWTTTDDDDPGCAGDYDDPDFDVPGEGSARDLDPNVFGLRQIGDQPSSVLEYGLSIFARNVRYCLHESEYLVLKLEPEIISFLADYSLQKDMVEAALRAHARAQTTGSTDSGLREMRKNVRKLISALDRILANLRTCLRDWDIFLGPGGGSEFFSMQDLNLCDLLFQIAEDFRDIAKVKDEIEELREKCFSHSKKMEWDVTEEKYTMAQRKFDNAEGMTKIGVWSQKATGITMLFIAPLALSCAFMAMPSEALPFKASQRAFYLLVLITFVLLFGMFKAATYIDGKKTMPLATVAVLVSTRLSAGIAIPGAVVSNFPRLPTVGLPSLQTWTPRLPCWKDLRSTRGSHDQDVELGALPAMPHLQRPVSVVHRWPRINNSRSTPTSGYQDIKLAYLPEAPRVVKPSSAYLG